MAAVPPGFPPLPGTEPEPVRKVLTSLGKLDEELQDYLQQPPVRTDWDECSAANEELQEESQQLRPATPLLCHRGGRGVRQLSLSNLGKSMLKQQSFQSLASPQAAELERGFSGTLSAPSTVKGASFKWARGETIGRGSLGTVFQALDQSSGRVLAVKEVAINPADDADLRFKADLENEVSILKDLQHPRIVSYLGHDYMDSCLYIYLEFMAGGSLASVLAQFGMLEESLILVYSREILEGLEFLHTRDPPVVHRDIKGGNVLVGLDCRVKLSDFGCSKRSQETWSVTMKGSIPWMAPEVIRHTGYGRRADIWSFGCVMVEMATAGSPWGKFDNPMAAMHKIGMSNATPPVPEALSEPCRELMGRCLQREVERRPTASELLESELLRDLLSSDF